MNFSGKVSPKRCNQNYTHMKTEKIHEGFGAKKRLRGENEFLRHQNNSLVVLLNDAQERKKASFNASQKRFFELTKAARNNKKRRIKNLVVQSLKGLQEFVPIEVCSFLPYFIFFATPLELLIDFISIINTVTSANNYQATVSSRLHSLR